MRKIAIAGSAKFYKESLQFKDKFEKEGYEVVAYVKKIDVTVEQEYKKTYEDFFNALNITDDFFLLNMDKNGIEGYIGYESFAELSFLVAKKIINNSNDTNIYIYKMPSEEVGCYDEINHFIKLGYIKLYKE